MKKLVCLLDPSWDYHKLVKVINENWNDLKDNTEIWVGCTHDKGMRTKRILGELEIEKDSKFLFPGTVGQGIYAGGKVSGVFVPKVIGKGFSLKRKIANFMVGLGNLSLMIFHRKTKRIPYLYLVLNKKTRVGKKVGAYDISDSEALEIIKNNLNKKINHIYIEGGSNAKHSVAERNHLLREIKFMTNKPLYCGGGIKSSKEFEDVIVADKIIVGHYFGENPNEILKFNKILKKI